MSLDGYLDSASMKRLVLSNDADFDRVDSVRASCDAILVGASTVRNDNPRLRVRSEHRRARREARGLPASPAKVTVTRTGRLDRCAKFFDADNVDKIVYCTAACADALRDQLHDVATVIDAGASVSMRSVSEDLHARGVRRLMVEGGGSMHTQFLTDELADELQVVVAPLFVGDSRARRFVEDGCYPWNESRRATLADVQKIGDVVLLRYALSARFRAD